MRGNTKVLQGRQIRRIVDENSDPINTTKGTQRESDPLASTKDLKMQKVRIKSVVWVSCLFILPVSYQQTDP